MGIKLCHKVKHECKFFCHQITKTQGTEQSLNGDFIWIEGHGAAACEQNKMMGIARKMDDRDCKGKHSTEGHII